MGSQHRIKYFFIIFCLIIASYSFRQLPWIGISPEVSHFFVGHYSIIDITANTGHIPPEKTYPGVSNFKTSLLDHWFRFSYFPVVLEVLGLEGHYERLKFLRLFTIQPLIFAFASLLIVGRRVSPKVRALAFILPLFVGQIAIARTAHGLYDWGFGNGFFMWAIAGLILAIQKDSAKWLLLTPVFAVLVFATRHTAGLVLIYSLFAIISGFYLFDLHKKHHILLTSVLTGVVAFMSHGIIFDYILNASGWGIIEIGRVFFSDGFARDVNSLSYSETETPAITLGQTLSLVDRILIILLFTIAILLWTAFSATSKNVYNFGLRVSNEANFTSYSIAVFALLGLIPASITFFFFKGIPGVIGRGQWYAALFLIIMIPCLLSIVYNEVDSKNLRIITVILLVALAIVSPAAYLVSDPGTSGSPWLTNGEAESLDTLRDHTPTEMRVFGSYHTTPPLVYTHPCVVGPWRMDFTQFKPLLDGYYYQVNQQNFQKSTNIADSQYGEINMILISEYATGSLGVQSKALDPGPAPDSIWEDYQSITTVHHTYSGKIHAYNTGADPSCDIQYDF